MFGDKAEIIPATIGAEAIIYKSDYHHTNNNTDKKVLLAGGTASVSDMAGFSSSYSNTGVDAASANRGFFSCIRI